jgi:hypothetical protein
MRFMVIRKADPDTERGALPTPALMAAMGRYFEEMSAAGIVREGNGLKPTAQGARVSFSGGRPTVIDGPFTESKELIAGYHILDVPTLQDAIEWTRKWPAEDGGGSVQLEIRPVIEPEDFGPEFTEDMREMRARIESRGA